LKEVLQMAEQLSVEDQRALAASLPLADPSRAQQRMNDQEWLTKIVAEQRARQDAGVVCGEPLAGKCVRPVVDLTEEDLDATLRETRTEWEKELDWI